MLTFEEIKQLIDLVCERKLRSVEIERSGFRVRIDGQAVLPQPFAAPAVAGQPREVAAAEGSESAAGGAGEAQDGELPPDTHILKSPIVGTFYVAPSPGADPYVQVGDSVEKGQVMCIVEAMKLMNEIEADIAGEVVEIYPSNAQPVEFGEPLFAIRSA